MIHIHFHLKLTFKICETKCTLTADPSRWELSVVLKKSVLDLSLHFNIFRHG